MNEVLALLVEDAVLETPVLLGPFTSFFEIRRVDLLLEEEDDDDDDDVLPLEVRLRLLALT